MASGKIAANNTTITKKSARWLDGIADQAQYIREMTMRYNLDLLEGEEPMTEAEMAQILGRSGDGAAN